MPLIECPECGQRVASVASVCPKCSRTLRHPAPAQRSRPFWPIPLILVAVLLVVGVITVPSRVENSPQLPTSTPPEPERAAPAPSPPPQSPRPAERAAPNSAGPPTQTKWTTTWVNLRQERGTDALVVRILNPGLAVEVDSLRGRWWTVYENGGAVGYVHNSVLQDNPPGS